MTEKQDGGDTGERDASPPTGDDRDLRSLLGGSAPGRRRGADESASPAAEPSRERPDRGRAQRDLQAAPPDESEEATPYEPPVRPWDEPVEEEPPPEDEPSQKMPPVWPGDEKQPWFRRERGMPPLPGSDEDEQGEIDPEEISAELADIPTRGRAFGLSFVLPQVLGFVPSIGIVVGTVFLFANLFLYRQGQDVGALAFKLRVIRSNGDVAGFMQMFVRNAASIISLLAVGAGFWSAFSDPERRTWHDKWLGTYVVRDSAEYKTRRRSSSDKAFAWFWIIILLAIALTLIIALSAPPESTSTPVE